MRSSLFAVVLLLVLMPAIALATAYRYTDDKGTLVIVDQESKVPEKYRPRVESFEMETHTDGYTPSYDEAVIAEDGPGSLWYKFENMSWGDRQRLVARAGVTDLGGVAGDMMPKFLLALALFIGAFIANFVFIKKRSLRFLNSMLIVMVFMLVITALYLQATVNRGDHIVKGLQARGQAGEQAGTSPSAEGIGGIMGQLRELQEMSAERQKLFNMLIEDDTH